MFSMAEMATIASTVATELCGQRQRDELYCGKGRDEYVAGRLDYVDSSCEKEVKPDPPPVLGCVEGNC